MGIRLYKPYTASNRSVSDFSEITQSSPKSHYTLQCSKDEITEGYY
jgi:hypothetical protein